MDESVAVLDCSPRDGGSYGGSSRDFAVLTPLPVMEAPRRGRVDAPTLTPPSRRTYIQKRLDAAMSATPSERHASSFREISEPLAVQRYHRLRLLGLLAAQLVAVAILVALVIQTPDVSEFLSRWITRKPLILVVWGGVTTVLLLVLYIVQHRDRCNSIVLVVFTVAQSLLVAGFSLWSNQVPIGLYFTTAIAVFTSLFAVFSCISCQSRDTDHRLWSLWRAGMVALAATLAIAAATMHLTLVRMTWTEWGYCMAFQSALALWLVFDANGLQACLAHPHEYWRGVVYFYTDIVLLLALLASLTCMLACGDSGDVICVGPVWCCGSCEASRPRRPSHGATTNSHRADTV